MAEPFLGQIMLCPYTFPPHGWADCAGQLLPISQYSALFSLLGTNYGGNGTSNFGLPDLQGRVPISKGQAPGGSPYVMGEPGGVEAVTLLLSEMAAHTHSLKANGGPTTTHAPADGMLARPAKLTTGGLYAVPPGDTVLSPLAIGGSGSNISHNTMQPFLVLRYVIALQGDFPIRP
jgi:microcystin-dependent protein